MDVTPVIAGVSLLLLMIAARVPVAFALISAGSLGLWMMRGTDFVLNTLATLPFSASAQFTLTLIPMYIFLGVSVVRGGVAADIFRAAATSKVLRLIPGGIGSATVAACAAFAAVSGSSVATAATMGRMALDEMRRQGYPATLAAGIIASAGTLGVLIPPSVVLIIYGIVSGVSIGDLLIAGIIPGLLTVAAYMILIGVLARLKVNLKPKAGAEDEGISLAARLSAFGKVAILFLIVIGGIYGGIFTATESGAVGALVAMLMMIWTLRRKRQNVLRNIWDGLDETARLTSMIFLLLIGGSLFARFLVAGRVPRAVAASIGQLEVGTLPVLLIIALAVLLLGMFVDAITILIIVVPVVLPLLQQLGVDPLWFGVIIVKLIEMGLVTPPVGLNAYVVAGVDPSVSVEEVFKGVIPFYLADIVVIALMTIFPPLVTYLPTLMRG